MFLSLDIPNRYGKVTLSSCLESFSRSETLDRDNQWNCAGCKRKVCAKKTMGVMGCAPVLVIHFKRFSATRFSKVDSEVDYPDILDSATFAKEPTGKYKLIGAIFHTGALTGGHYTAAVFDPIEDQWYHFSDSLAYPISASGAHKQSAYILFYERI
jgi:ubiquitin C-terminal hydrolase